VLFRSVAPPARQPVPKVVALPDQSQAIPRVATADGARVPEPPLRGTADPNAVPLDPRFLRSEDDVAAEAFRLAEAQRARIAGPGTLDTQPAGTPRGAADEGTTPRLQQDFVARSASPLNPEFTRVADAPVDRQPAQTFRTTPPDSNNAFPGATPGRGVDDGPLGRTPIPRQREPYRDTARPGEAVNVKAIEAQVARLTQGGEPRPESKAGQQVARLRETLMRLEAEPAPRTGPLRAPVPFTPRSDFEGWADGSARPAPAEPTTPSVGGKPAAPNRSASAPSPEVARIEQQIGRLTARGEPTPGTAAARQVEKLRAKLARVEGAPNAHPLPEGPGSRGLPVDSAARPESGAAPAGRVDAAPAREPDSLAPDTPGARAPQRESTGQGAVETLLRERQGSFAGAFRHPALGPIDLIWGKPGPKGNGLAHIAELHPEVLPRLASLIESGSLLPSSTPGRARIALDNDRAVVALNRNGANQRWVLTAYDATVPRAEADARRAAAFGRAASSGEADAIPSPPSNRNIRDVPSGGKENSAPRLYSTPFDPAAIRRFIAEPAMAGARKLRDALLSSTAARTVGDNVRHFLASNRAVMRAIAERHPTVREVRDMADMLASDPGGGRHIRETYQTAADSTAKSYANRLRNVLGPKPDAAAEARIRDELTSGRRLSPEAQHVRKLLDEFHGYLKKANVESAQSRVAYLESRVKALVAERAGAEEIGRARRVLEETKAEAKTAGNVMGYVRGRYFPRLYDAERALKNTEGFLRDAGTVYRKMGLSAGEARLAAEDWLDRLAGVGRGAADFGHSPVSAKFTKGRELPADADQIMRDWLVTDARTALEGYFIRGSKAAEFTRRFGRNGEKAEEMFTAMFRQGVSSDEIALMRRAFASSTGTLASAASGPGHAITGWIQTLGPLAVLPRAVIASLVEGLTLGSRTGNLWRGLEGFAETWREVARSATGDVSEARRVAEMMGIVSDGLVDMRAAAVMDAAANTHLQQRLASGMFRVTGMHAVTQAQRIAGTRIGQKFIGQMVEEVVTGARTQASARRLLAELGIGEADARRLHTWLSRNDGTPRIDDLLGDSAEAGLYRGAIRRFVNEAIQNPEAVDKPALANHHVGRLAYGITSFMFAFTRNVLIRSLKEGAEGMTGEGYTLADRARLMGPLVGYMVLAAAQYGMSTVREKLFNPQQNAERDDVTKTILSLDRTGVFGTLSPIVNMITSAKYDRDPSSMLTGPYLAHFAMNVGKIALGMVPQPMGPNSGRTNNAEHSAIRAAHAAVLAPAISAAAALAPGGAVLQAAYGIGTMFATSRGAGRALADEMVGPPTVRPRQPGARSGGGISSGGGIRSGGGVRSSGGISAGGGISAR